MNHTKKSIWRQSENFSVSTYYTTALYHTKVQVILSANPFGNGRSLKPLQFQRFPICQKNL